MILNGKKYNSIAHKAGLCKYKGIQIIEGHMMLNHIYLLLAISPKHNVSLVMGYLKGYYVSTVDLNKA